MSTRGKPKCDEYIVQYALPKILAQSSSVLPRSSLSTIDRAKRIPALYSSLCLWASVSIFCNDSRTSSSVTTICDNGGWVFGDDYLLLEEA